MTMCLSIAVATKIALLGRMIKSSQNVGQKTDKCVENRRAMCEIESMGMQARARVLARCQKMENVEVNGLHALPVGVKKPHKEMKMHKNTYRECWSCELAAPYEIA